MLTEQQKQIAAELRERIRVAEVAYDEARKTYPPFSREWMDAFSDYQGAQANLTSYLTYYANTSTKRPS
jgi:hypothetical protein